MKKEEKKGQKAKKEKQGAIRSLSGKIERTAEPPVGQEEKKDTGGQMEQLHPRLQEVLKAIESVQNAKREFGKLLAAGCDRTDLLATLFNSFGGSRKELQAGLKLAFHLRDKLPRAADRLEEDAKEVEGIFTDLRNAGITLHVPEYEEVPRF